MLQLALDTHFEWPSVIRLANYPTTEITITAVDALFTSWGHSKIVISDNGPKFASQEFSQTGADPRSLDHR